MAKFKAADPYSFPFGALAPKKPKAKKPKAKKPKAKKKAGKSNTWRAYVGQTRRR